MGLFFLQAFQGVNMFKFIHKNSQEINLNPGEDFHREFLIVVCAISFGCIKLN